MLDKRILIAEDERPMANILHMKLEKEGIKSDVAYNGQEALEKIKEQEYDLLLLDLMMPIVDGFGVLEKMNQEDINIPVIITSNLSQGKDIERTKDLGVVDYFVKSNISLVDIVERIRNFLNN